MSGAWEDLFRRAAREPQSWTRRMVREECRAALAETDVPPTEDPIVDIKGAAKLAGVKARTIRDWVRQGRIHPLGSKPYKFTRGEVIRARDRNPVDDNVVAFDATRKAEELLAAKRRRGR